MRKNVIKFTAIALLSAFALTACDDDIIAKPTGYDDNSPIVTNVGDIYNNNLQDIYDSIRAGNLASDVLDELLYQYSVSVFGNYNKVTASKISSSLGQGTTLKEAVASAKSEDKTKANEFIKAHSAFWTKNKDGKRVNDADAEVADDANPSQQEYDRLTEKWNTIEKRIAKAMYSSISSGAYTDRGIFQEKKFLKTLASSIENKVADATTDLFEGVISPSVEDYDIFNEEIPEGGTVAKGKTKNSKGEWDFILHRQHYQANYRLNEVEEANSAISYVEDHIIPDIYRQLLVEQYILDETFDTLGRTSARHISVLAIKKNANYAKNATDVMNAFLNENVFKATRTTPITLDTFKMVSNAWVGTFMSQDGWADTDENKLMKAALGENYYQTWQDKTGSTPVDRPYYPGTAYGDMIEELKKVSNNPALSENESTFTGNNAYPISVGRQIKINELETNDYTSTGWYVKSVGAGSLPDSIKNQLFDINVANALTGKESEACVEYYVEGGAFKCNLDQDAYKNNPGSLINVVGKIKLEGVKDQYFLRNTNRIKGDPFQNDLLFESDGTYYMVLVEDAIRSTNLNKENYGAGKLSYTVLENYVNEIVSIVADNDTYKTLSKKHWVEKMELKYHDQVVYDYFKANFPDLFDDDDSDSSSDKD